MYRSLAPLASGKQTSHLACVKALKTSSCNKSVCHVYNTHYCTVFLTHNAIYIHVTLKLLKGVAYSL